MNALEIIEAREIDELLLETHSWVKTFHLDVKEGEKVHKNILMHCRYKDREWIFEHSGPYFEDSSIYEKFRENDFSKKALEKTTKQIEESEASKKICVKEAYLKVYHYAYDGFEIEFMLKGREEKFLMCDEGGAVIFSDQAGRTLLERKDLYYSCLYADLKEQLFEKIKDDIRRERERVEILHSFETIKTSDYQLGYSPEKDKISITFSFDLKTNCGTFSGSGRYDYERSEKSWKQALLLIYNDWKFLKLLTKEAKESYKEQIEDLISSDTNLWMRMRTLKEIDEKLLSKKEIQIEEKSIEINKKMDMISFIYLDYQVFLKWNKQSEKRDQLNTMTIKTKVPPNEKTLEILIDLTENIECKEVLERFFLFECGRTRLYYALHKIKKKP